MKKSALLVGFALLSLLFQTCRDEESVNMRHVQFTFSASALEEAGGRTASDLPEGSVLFVSITKSTGDVVHTLKELTLLKFGDEFVSAPLPLPQGHYRITEFLVANADHDVLYATPQEGSPLAPLVEHPLPIAFHVAGNEMTDLAVEVISTSAHLPEEFGYVSFSIEVVPTEAFQLSVFIPGENGVEFTSAQAYILHEGDTIYHEYLSPGVNSIPLDENPDDSVTLVLIEPGYKKYSRTFTLTELHQEIDDLPLSVILPPALTFVTVPIMNTSGDAFVFSTTAYVYTPTSVNLVIDWGDGSIEVITSDDSFPQHIYATQNPYFVSVSGDLELIHLLSLFYGNEITEISVRNLPELRDFGMGVSVTPATVDLSYNKKLESVNFAMSTFTSLDVSQNTALKDVDLFMNDFFTSESLNKMIHDLLQNAIANNIHEGSVNIHGFEKPLVGPPSELAKEELRTLRDDYGWYIYPEEF